MMELQDKIKKLLMEALELEKTFQEAGKNELLSTSFFISSCEILNRLETGVNEMMCTQIHFLDKQIEDGSKKIEASDSRYNDLERKYENLGRKYEELGRKYEDLGRKYEDSERKYDDFGKKYLASKDSNPVEAQPKLEIVQATVPEVEIVDNISEVEKVVEEKVVPVVNVLADTFNRKVRADFGRSLSLNDRFMFQRDLFQGSATKMNQAFTQLNESHSLPEALDFLDETYAIAWNSDSGIALKELLEKRFA